jgi:hypothetical protein
MAGGCERQGEHPTTDLPNSATNAAGVTSQGGDPNRDGGSEASGPRGLLPRGRTRTGLEVEITTRSTGPMVTHGKCSGRAHTGPPTYRGTTVALWALPPPGGGTPLIRRD